MQKIILFLFSQALFIAGFAQKIEQGFDASFKLTKGVARYYVVTEKEGQSWHRKAYYFPEKTMAMEGWYKDENGKIPNGDITWFYPNRNLHYKGQYVDGKKEGIWLVYHDNGMMSDSATYAAGRLKGIRLQWNNEGVQTDSSRFDGAGNGIEVGWYQDGTPSYSGAWISDTVKNKRWQYFHPNGKLAATEDYLDGKRIASACFNEEGQPLDAELCTENEAQFPGGHEAWIKFIQRNLNASVPVQRNAPIGQYTVMVQFTVNKDGTIIDIKPLTKFGFGMEEEVLRMMKKSPRWNPAQQFGRKVKAYRKQPITFVVTKG